MLNKSLSAHRAAAIGASLARSVNRLYVTSLLAAIVRSLGLVTRRWPTMRLATSVAHYAGLALPRSPHTLTAVGRLCSGSRIVLDLRDRSHRHIYLYGIDEDDTTALVMRLAAPGWHVLDIGANIGYYALLCSDLGGPESRIYAFEPQPALAAMLKASATIAGASVSVIEAACGDENGEAVLYESADPNQTVLATMIPSYYTVTTKPRRVPLIRLDDFCSHNNLRVDLVKVDVEGSEWNVVRGMSQMLARHHPHLICEIEPNAPGASALLGRLSDLSYTPLRIGPGGSLIPFVGFKAGERPNLYFAPPSAGA